MVSVLLVCLMLVGSMSVVSADSIAIENEILKDVEIQNYGISYNVVWPTTSRRITSHFGPRGGSFHYGVDVGPVRPGVAGDPINAMAAGRVVYAGWASGYGNVVYLNSQIQKTYHGVELQGDYESIASDDIEPMDVTVTILRQSRYAHLHSISVSNGNNVSRNARLGTMGTTGNSTGVHLHLETRTIDSLTHTNPPSSNAHDPLIYYPHMTFQSIGTFDAEGNFYDVDMLLELSPSEIDKLGISVEEIDELISDEYVKEMITESEMNTLMNLSK